MASLLRVLLLNLKLPLPLRVRALPVPLAVLSPLPLLFNHPLQLLNLLTQSLLRKLTLKPNSKRMLQSSKH